MSTTPHPPAPASASQLTQAWQRAQACTWLNAFTFLPSAVPSSLPAPSGLLQGLPLVVKDNLDVAGMPTTGGSRALTGNVVAHSCTAVARLQAAGAQVLGKANMHELSFGITSNNAAYGAVHNPYASGFIAGGSSGGTAAAVAARLVPAGLGSDTGGSLRIPAAMCGVVGFRPTTGRWPSDGVLKISNTRDTVGPIALTAASCALLDAVVCGEPEHLPPLALAGLRVGVPRPLFWQQLDDQVQSAAEKVLALLQGAGVVLVECDVGLSDAHCVQTGMTIAMAETLPGLHSYLNSHGLAFDAQAWLAGVTSPDVKGIFASLLQATSEHQRQEQAAAYQDALEVQRPALQKQYADCFARHQLCALIFPTTPLAAARIGEDDSVQLCGQAVPTFLTYTRNVGPGSVVGLPGISLPMGLTAQGLPMGIALDGPAGSDRQLLALAVALQALLPPMPAPVLKAP